MTDSVTGRPVTPETLFQAASISKPVAALALMRIVEAGRLDLDTDVNGQLESWTVPDEGGFSTREKVTLRRLLNHSAGTTVWGFPGYGLDEPVPSTVGVLEGRGNTDPVTLFREPGLDWQYSGGGYTVAQLLAEEVLDAPFADLMEEWVLGPVSMTRSTYAQPLPEDRLSEAAVAHRADGTRYPGGMHVYPELAAAGLWSTPTELLRYARAVQDAVVGRDGAVLSPGLATEMLRPGFNNHGLGPGLQEGGAHFGHGGSNAGFRSTLTASIHDGYGVAVMTNGDLGSPLAAQILLTVANLYGWVGPSPSVRRVVALDASEIEALLGRYRVEGRDLTLDVARDREGIVVNAPGGEQRFNPESPTRFWDRTTGQIMIFELGPTGQGLALEVGGIRAVRVEGGD